MEPGHRCKYGDKTKVGLPKNRDSIPGMGKRSTSRLASFKLKTLRQGRRALGPLKGVCLCSRLSLGAVEQTELSPKLGLCTTKPCEEVITLVPICRVYTHIHNITF
jgi:hypothetical protein